MIKNYVKASFSFLGENLMKKLADSNIEELDIQELENIPSSFAENEQKWLK